MSVVIESSFAEGCDWCVENVKSSPFSHLASELEIAKAVTFLKMKEFSKAVQALKAFERMESNMLSTAATNLSFLYFLEKELEQAQHYADVAINADRYNAKGADEAWEGRARTGRRWPGMSSTKKRESFPSLFFSFSPGQ